MLLKYMVKISPTWILVSVLYCDNNLIQVKPKYHIESTLHWLHNPGNDVVWSLLICTLDERAQMFEKLHKKVWELIKKENLHQKIEILFFRDNMQFSVGCKRNALVSTAQGKYISFLDDDDDISDNYISGIYPKLLQNPDCVALQGQFTYNGENPKKFIHSIKYRTYFEQNGVYYRPPNHLNPIKKELIKDIPFPDKSFNEDTDWAMQIAQRNLLKQEQDVDFVYYYYQFESEASRTAPKPVSKYNDDHYYCTAADERHFYLLKNLIGSIHHVDFNHLKEIAVFDLGLNSVQITELNTMQKVKVYSVEMVHPELLTHFVTSPQGRQVRGYFAWKPVILKQALEMFPYVLYVDAGTTILRSVDALFEYIQEKGYFLLSCTHNDNCNLGNRLTRNVIDTIIAQQSYQDQKLLLSDATYHIDGGLQGLSRAMLNNYVMPMYNFAKNIDLFKDDGTAKFGYGAGRHDQTLYTILAYLQRLTIHPEGFSKLEYNNQQKSIHIYWDRSELNDQSIIYRSRQDIAYQGGKSHYIKYNK